MKHPLASFSQYFHYSSCFFLYPVLAFYLFFLELIYFDFNEHYTTVFPELSCHSPLPAGLRTASMAFIDNQKEWDMATPRRSNLLVKPYLRCSLTAKW